MDGKQLARAAEKVVREHLREEGLTNEQITQALPMWKVTPHADGDALLAAVMTAGTEIHLVMAPEHRGKGLLSRRHIRAMLKPLLDEYGYATTRAGKGNARDRLFLDRLGFYPTWADEKFMYFMLTALPFDKGG